MLQSQLNKWSIRAKERNVPANEMFGLTTEVDFIWEEQKIWPVDDLLVCVTGELRAERRVTNETLEHNGPE